MASTPNQTAERDLAVSPAEAARRAGLGRTTIYLALKSGELRSLKICSRRLVPIDALKAWLEAHEVQA